MRSTVKRFLVLLFGALALSLLGNQIYSEGIRWHLLKPQFSGAGNSAIQYVSADSAFILQMEREVTFVDVRTEEEFEIDHLPGAISIPLFVYYKTPELLEELDKQHLYILYCFDPECPEAASLAKEMMNQHFTEVLVLAGGFSGWLEMGFPIEAP